MKAKTLPISKLRKLLAYDPASGLFTWKVWCGNCTTIGARAGTLKKAKGYRYIKINGIDYREHRLAWALHYGVWPKRGLDHRDQDRTNNKIDNLRLATDAQNSANQPHRISASGYRGVKWFGDRCAARITVKGTDKHIGMFDTAEEAARARDEAALKYHGEYAMLNFPRVA